MGEPAGSDDAEAVNARPTTPEGQEWMDSLHADADNGSLWRTPSIREQLKDRYQRLRLAD
jgi:hypothetical protein